MEHRLGQRFNVAIAVRLSASNRPWRNPALLANLSVSGGFVAVDLDVRVLTRIQIAVEFPEPPPCNAPTVEAYVVRRDRDGIGVEWCEFAPPVVIRLLQAELRRPGAAGPNTPLGDGGRNG